MGKRADWIFARWVAKTWSHLGGPSSRAPGNDRVIMPRFVSKCLSASARSPTWNSPESTHGALPWRVCNNDLTAVNWGVRAVSPVRKEKEGKRESVTSTFFIGIWRQKKIVKRGDKIQTKTCTCAKIELYQICHCEQNVINLRALQRSFSLIFARFLCNFYFTVQFNQTR